MEFSPVKRVGATNCRFLRLREAKLGLKVLVSASCALNCSGDPEVSEKASSMVPSTSSSGNSVEMPAGAGVSNLPPSGEQATESLERNQEAPAEEMALAGDPVDGNRSTDSRLQDSPGELGGDFSQTSAELLSSLQLGWNLGNSLDVPEGETAWGNPVVTQDLFRTVTQAGFDLVRIPVTWSLHTGPAPEYLIEASWLDRVEQVVGFAQTEGLYVIINLHHDGADEFEGVEWLSLNDSSGAVTTANNSLVEARYEALWRQIAERFVDSGESLLFESMNEIHDGYGPPDPQYFEILNHLNQVFVDLVRSTGGNNSKRHLVVPGYNTNIEHTVAGFALPSDIVAGRLILSAHYYDPYLFTLAGETNTWGTESLGRDDFGQEEAVVAQFDLLAQRYVQQGIPVILGEYGAGHQAGFEDYRRYYMEYVTKAATDRSIVPIYWDNGGQGSGAENFGLIDRLGLTELHPTVLDAMRRASSSSYALQDVAPPIATEAQ